MPLLRRLRSRGRLTSHINYRDIIMLVSTSTTDATDEHHCHNPKG
nr:MAG TPA: hypothetical protein [Caudoviricetes sp.]